MKTNRERSNPKKAQYIASVEPSGVNPDGSVDERYPLVIDAVPLSDIQEFSRRLRHIEEKGLDEPFNYLLLKIDFRKELVDLSSEQGNFSVISVCDQALDQNGWIEAQSVLASNEQDRVPLYIKFESKSITNEHKKTLESIANFKHIKESKDLDKLLSRNKKLLSRNKKTKLAVAVYDVGQASLTGVVNSFEHPIVFFDLGWPASFNNKSLPEQKQFNPFELEDRELKVHTAPVILSHLDWDHWAYAIESGRAVWDSDREVWKTKPIYRKRALARPWILQRPKLMRHNLGGSHIHFVKTLSETKLLGGCALHFWPESKSSIEIGQGCVVYKCKPNSKTPEAPAFLRNNESLAMTVTDIASGARTLLPGDADYPSIPYWAKWQLTGLVAAHHGGKVTKGSIPSATGHGRKVISTFPGCYSNIPCQDVITESQEKGWGVVNTSDRMSCPKNNQCITGSRIIRLGYTPNCGCGGVKSGCLCLHWM
jgi:hypothetical protein